ncbi:MAG: hypothetical protein O3A10_06665 [Chloroflexi bacterium]|nr:hypothetical protein [Chloroflexota bacterium]
MWGVLIGTAAAHKAAAVGVGLSVILGTAGTAEVTGIGPTVRDIVRHEAVQESASDAIDEGVTREDESALAMLDEDESTISELALESEATSEDESALDEDGEREHFALAAEDGPGNLVWHLKDGVFHLRGTLIDAGDGLAIRTAGPDGEVLDLLVDEDSVDLRIPGGHAKDGDIALDDYLGAMVRATGTCVASTDAEAAPDCTVETLRILGNAGRNDAGGRLVDRRVVRQHR